MAMKRVIIFIATILCIAVGEVMGSVYWIGGEVGPPGWGIEPASPNSSDVIVFAGPTSQVFSNECYAEMGCRGTPAITVDPCGKTIELWFEPPWPSICPAYYDPVCGLGGTFGPPEAGHWEFFGNNQYATFSIEFDVEGVAQTGPVCYHVDAADGNDLNDGLSRETAFATIQRGIDAAVDGNTVLVWPGVYTGGGNRDLDFGGKAITVQGTGPEDPCVVAATIIDCNGSDAEPHRGFYFHSGEDGNSIVKGFTITNGYGGNGGGVYCDGSSPKISNCNIAGNYGFGGGIYCVNSSAEIANCAITDNNAPCYFYNPLWICVDGGGIALESSSAIIRNCVISGNRTSAYGGGVFCYSGSPVIENCTIAGNFADGDGGGLRCFWQGVVTVRNCILSGNTASGCAQISLAKAFDDCPTVMISYSVVEGGQGQIGVNGCPSSVDWGAGNGDTEPNFADPCGGDYHLQSTAGRWEPNSESWVTDDGTSVGIDGGDPNWDWSGELWPHGKRINIGAYGGTAEASMSSSSVGNIANLDNDVNDIVGGIDLGLFVEKWCYEEPLLAEDLDRDGLVNFVDFAIFAAECSSATVPETSISYQIEDCNAGSKAAVESGETRFSATVAGSYIHFEDMMRANCCPDELLLEMDVDGNVITIYEREVLVTPCFCICDYPVTATLGPFEPGTYTFEVYEDSGGFIGSTIVTIGL